MKSLIALAVAAVATVAGLARTAAADPRIAVAPFDGDRTGDLRDTVIELLETDYRVMASRDVTLAMKKLDLDDLDSKKALAKLAAELDADGVITGTIEPDGNKSKLTLLVYVRSRKSAFRMTTRYNSTRQVRESSLKDDLSKALGRSGEDDSATGHGGNDRDRDRDRGGDDRDRDRGSDRGGDDDRDRDRGGDRGGDDDRDRGGDDGDRDRDRGGDDGDRERGGDDDRDRDHGRTSSRDGDDDDGISRRGDDDDDDRDDDRRGNVRFIRTARKAAVRLEVGVSGTGRQLTFLSNLPADQAPPGYKSNLVPGARFHGELYPLALQNPDSAAAGLGLAADFDRAIGLTTTSSLAPDKPLTTTSQMWSVGVRYRIAYGNRALNPTFTLGVGYGKRAFKVDRGPLMGMTLDLPDVDYTYIDPMLGARIPLATSAAITVTGKFLAMRSSGPIGTNDEYGQAKITGIDVDAGFEFILGKYVLIHFSGLFTQLGYTFKGGAVQTNGRDGNSADVDVGGARDRYFGAMGTVGVLY